MRNGEDTYTEVKKANGFNVNRFVDNSTENLIANITKLTSKESTNATYTMNKTPIEVSKGDKVKYSINIYNEGEVAAKARIIKDYIPAGLKLIKVEYGNIELSKYDEATSSSNTDKNFYTYNENNNYATIYLNEADYINAFNGSKLESDSIIVHCEVLNTATGVLTNVAEISCYTTVGGVDYEKDIDSTKDNWIAPNGEDKLTSTKDSENWRKYSNEQDTYLDGAWHPIQSQDAGVDGNKGDDDDFDKLVVNKNYNFVIKKVNASNNNTGIDDIKFNITRKTDLGEVSEEKFENVETNNSIIQYAYELSASDEGSITYTIKEIENKAYVQLKEALEVQLVVEKGVVTGYKVNYGNNALSNNVETQTKTFPVTNAEGIELNITVEFSDGNVSVRLENKVVEGAKYGLKLRKVSLENNEPLQGVAFTAIKKVYTPNVTTSTDEAINFSKTNAEGYTSTEINVFNIDNYNVKDEYHITEIDLGTNTGYTKLNEEIVVTVEKTLKANDELAVSKFTVKAGSETKVLDANNLEDTITIVENEISYIVKFELDSSSGMPILCVIVPNAPDKTIPLQIKKVDAKDGTTITGTDYSIYKQGIETPLFDGIDNVGLVKLTDGVKAGNHTLVYKVVEENAKEGYDNIFYNKYIQLTVQVANGIATGAEVKVFNNDGTEDTSLTDKVSAEIIDVENVKTVQLVIKNPETIEIIDLALKKIVTEINGKKVDSSNILDSKFDRLTEGKDKFRIDTTPLKNGKLNAEYYLNKTPIIVLKGSTIKYQIRIYNEGKEVDATASKITDYIPEGLQFVNVYYQNETTPLVANKDYTFDATNNILKINVLGNKELIKKYENGDTLDYDYVTIECKVKDIAKDILTNVAQISEYKSEDGIVEKDRDSQPNNWKNPNDGNSNNNDTTNKSSNKWQEYKGHESNEYEEGKFKEYLGQQDDDDFEKIIVGEIDLVLKKVITHINKDSVSTLDSKFHRFQNGKVEVDTDLLNQNNKVTTAKYYLNKTPIKVKINDTVTYQIRIYNE